MYVDCSEQNLVRHNFELYIVTYMCEYNFFSKFINKKGKLCNHSKDIFRRQRQCMGIHEPVAYATSTQIATTLKNVSQI